MAWEIMLPMPGTEKMDSTTTEPAMMEPICMPTTVSTGMTAFFSSCLKMMTFSDNPLAGRCGRNPDG